MLSDFPLAVVNFLKPTNTKKMKYEFKFNGTVKLTIEPSTSLERELFKELFSNDVTISPSVNAASTGQVTIEKGKSIGQPE